MPVAVFFLHYRFWPGFSDRDLDVRLDTPSLFMMTYLYLFLPVVNIFLYKRSHCTWCFTVDLINSPWEATLYLPRDPATCDAGAQRPEKSQGIRSLLPCLSRFAYLPPNNDPVMLIP